MNFGPRLTESNCNTDLDFDHCPLYCMEALPGLVASPVLLYSSGCSRFPQELCISVNICHVKLNFYRKNLIIFLTHLS